MQLFHDYLLKRDAKIHKNEYNAKEKSIFLSLSSACIFGEARDTQKKRDNCNFLAEKAVI